MKNIFYGVTPIIGICSNIILTSPVVALSSAQIATQAQEFTVMIDGREQGSGVIIEGNGNNYTVLTNWHVVNTLGVDPHTGENVTGYYEVITYTGQKYIIDDEKIKHLKGYDLATLEFISEQTYTVARKRTTNLQLGEMVYTAGFPIPFAEIPERSMAFLNAQVEQQIAQGLEGYSIIHSRGATPGTSGGALLDYEGYLAGINGQAFYNGNTGTTFGKAIPLQIYLNQKSNFEIPFQPSPPQDSVSLGKRKSQGDDYQEAIILFDQALAHNPDDLQAYYERAIAYYRLGNYSQAIADFNELISRNPNNSDAYVRRGFCFAKLKEYEKAIADYNQAIFFNPDDLVAFKFRRIAYRELTYRKQIADYSHLINLNPNDHRAYNRRGSAYRNSREYEKAIADYTQAITLNPRFITAYNNRGLAYSHLKDYDRAIADYTQAITLNPRFITAYNNRGLAYSHLKDYDRAIADYTQAITLNPRFVTAYNNRGLAYSHLKDYDRAIADYTQAITINPSFANAYHNRGVAYMKLRAYNQAFEDYNQALTLNPYFTMGYYNRGNLHFQLQDYEKAIADYSQGISLNNYHNYDSEVIDADNEENATMSDYEQSINNNFNIAIIYYNRGLAYQKLEKYHNALADFRQALRLYQQQGETQGYNNAMNQIRELEN
jgi:tetratricopeptide (TPR) repeat protein